MSRRGLRRTQSVRLPDESDDDVAEKATLVIAVGVVMLVPAMLASKNPPDNRARDGVMVAQATCEAAPLTPELRAARATYLYRPTC